MLALLAIVLQVIEWTTLGFGPASGGYASVFVGWTAFYAVFTLGCVYWIETQVATAWRRRAGGRPRTAAERRPAEDVDRLIGPGSRPARSSGRSTSRSACCCSSSSTWSVRPQ